MLVCKELLLFEKNKNGQWEGPRYLPDEFNVGCVETPFYSADNQTLFFSAMRTDVDKTGKKITDDNFNIYFSRRIDVNNWFYPVYMDEINTEFDDLSPILTSSGNYFIVNVKNRKSKKQPQKIYTATLPDDKKPIETFVLSGNITDLYSKQPLEANIIVQDALSSVTMGEYKSTAEGNYSIILTLGNMYKVDFFKKGYSHSFYNTDLTYIPDQTTDVFNVTLFDNVNLELNVYDNELFYPLNPVISIKDSISGKKLADGKITGFSKGKYNCNLLVDKIYTINVACENFNPATFSFDLRTDVIYSNFEKSVELQAGRKTLVLNVTNKAKESILPADIEITNLSRDERAANLLIHDQSGKPSMSLRLNDEYELNVSKKGYTYFNDRLKVENIKPEVWNIELDSLTNETKMVFNNITFETNSAELKAESYDELNRIVTFMKANPDIRIELSAHTDDIASEAYNQKLSNRRAASVAEFLIGNDVPETQMVSKGYGKSSPLVPNDSDENRALNRRVEIKIIN